MTTPKGTDVTDSETAVVVMTTLVETLGLHDRAATITEETLLFGSMPELDSLALVELIGAIENRFGIQMHDEDISGDVFESVGTLAARIGQRLES